MNKIQHTTVTLAFLASLGLSACDRFDGAEHRATVGTRDTFTPMVQPNNMPAPQVVVEGGPPSRDSIATKPLDKMTPEKESKTMPEAGQGNNHSSPSFKPSTSRGFRGPERRVLWV
jgi:hypothetical protein